MRTWMSCVVVMAVATVAGLSAGCGSREQFNARITYVLEPTKELPAGLKTVAIVCAAEIVGDEDADRANKWSTIAADMMEQMIQESANKAGRSLTVAKRRDTAKVLAEQDLKAAGLVDAGPAARAAKLLDVQALITSKLNIRVEVKKSKKTTFDITDIAGGGGHGWGAGAASITPREADEISRNMTLQCKFSMIDAATSEALFEYAPRPFRKMDQKKPGVLFGRSRGEADLDPVDMYIGELVERGVRDFVSMFLPTEIETAYTLESGKG
jgi:hypothetical protein